MGKLRIKRQKSRLLAVLLAFILPGMGHVYSGQYPKGLLLMAAFLLDLTAIIRLADSDGGRHLLLIIYLVMMLPIFYFIGVFDSLQSMEQDEESDVQIGMIHGILLLSAGIVMLILLKPPHSIMPWMNELAELSVGPIIIATSILMLLLRGKGSVSMFRLGRFTAAALILTVGALLLWDQIQGRNDIVLLGEWWPVLFILLGIEIIVFSLKFRNKEKRLKFDAGGGMIALVITVTAFVVTQYADIPFRWLDQFNVDLSGTTDFSEEKGFRYDKTIVKVPLDEAISLIRVVNPNGQVSIKSGDVEEIELQTAVWVDLTDEAEASAIAENSKIKVTPGGELTLEAKGEAYGANGSRKPRMNMVITMPMSMSDQLTAEDQPLDSDSSTVIDTPEESAAILPTETPLTSDAPIPIDVQKELETPTDSALPSEGDPEALPDNHFTKKPLVKLKIESANGSVDVKQLTLTGGVEIRSTSGVITVTNIQGEVAVKGNNGDIHVNEVSGDSSLETKYGTITVSEVQGKLYANTLNGSLEINNVAGNIEVETKNGKIRIDGAGASVKADTLNGSIELNSPIVGGNWDLDSSVGEVKLSMPSDSQATVYGSVTFGSITTELPLDVSKKTIRGSLGAGTYRIQINATNSIIINRYGLS